ncbi:hypothetical protein ACE3NQ_20535 [Paenibacillus terreus]|uniref:Uncharacterized protein n=1 Tax=Paenibacillus terreus TaxID=1387834 RepID=A0ABV5BC81_9BACL
MNRERRLQSAAASWLKSYDGNSCIRGYRKHFGVNGFTISGQVSKLYGMSSKREITGCYSYPLTEEE